MGGKEIETKGELDKGFCVHLAVKFLRWRNCHGCDDSSGANEYV